MKRVVSHSQTGAGKNNLMLQEDALKDIVRFYAAADDIDGANDAVGDTMALNRMHRRIMMILKTQFQW